MLSGLRALVTGASSGVGRALALELSRRGVHVLATARREPLLSSLAAEQAAGLCGPAIVYAAGDITSADFRRHVIATAVEQIGGLDIVVAAAGSGAIGAFGAAAPDTLNRIMEINFFAPAELVRQSLPVLAASYDPAVVFVGSILGYHSLPLHADYCAAKSAVRSLAGTLRMELEADGIGVLLASLGPTESEFWNHLISGRRPEWSRGKQMTAARTAVAITVALERRRREIVPGFQAKAFVLIARLFPSLITAILKQRFQRDVAVDHNQPQ